MCVFSSCSHWHGDQGDCTATQPRPRSRGPLPLSIACNLFKAPSLWGIKHTAPYFHDNSSSTLEEIAEQYTFMFMREAGILLTPQDEADIVAFLKLL
jgi:hypothetical protein